MAKVWHHIEWKETVICEAFVLADEYEARSRLMGFVMDGDCETDRRWTNFRGCFKFRTSKATEDELLAKGYEGSMFRMEV